MILPEKFRRRFPLDFTDFTLTRDPRCPQRTAIDPRNWTTRWQTPNHEPMTLISGGRGSSRTVNKLPLDIIDPYNIGPYRLIN